MYRVNAMNHYQLLCIFPGTLAETEVSGAVGQVRELIATEGGTLVEAEDLGKRRLAYPMKQIRYGYYHHLFFQAESEHILRIKKKLPLMETLLRIMIFTYNPSGRAAQHAWAERRATSVRQISREDQGVDDVRGNEEEPRGTHTSVDKRTQIEERGKVDLKEIDKKLDELLESTIDAV